MTTTTASKGCDMKVMTSELSGPALDWAVAKCENHATHITYAPKGLVYIPKGKRSFYNYCPTTNWKQGGPIIEREWIELLNGSNLHPSPWSAVRYDPDGEPISAHGNTPLIAAMRCYATSELGDEVDVPEGLLK